MPPTPRHSATPLLLLGGTFDPPHIAHLLLAECARLEVDPTGRARVLFLPAGDPYRKTDPTRAAPEGVRVVSAAHHRREMLRLALRGNPHFALDDRELHRPGPTYTIDTLRELHAEGHRDLILILGSDALADLPNWREPQAVVDLARIRVAPKPGSPGGLITHHASRITSMPPLAVSSTLIRARVAAGLPIRYLVPPAVESYIAAHGLYGELSG